MLDTVRRMAREFDILHFHIDQLHFPLFRDIAAVAVIASYQSRKAISNAAYTLHIINHALDIMNAA